MRTGNKIQAVLAILVLTSILLSACIVFPPTTTTPPPPLPPQQNQSNDNNSQPEQRTCRTRVIEVQPNDMTLFPPKTRGDREFDGHGPQYTVRATLLVTEYEISVELYMIAEETQSDWSTAEGSMVESLYYVGPNERISGVLTPLRSSASGTDQDHAIGRHSDSGLVREFLVMGDSPGDDIEWDTSVKAVFRPVQIQLMETGNCAQP